MVEISARAIVRGTKIILIDEATSNVDYETDARIQLVLRQEFKNCTVIAIAHRISTVLRYDRIVVMDAGTLAELESPRVLWERGVFRGLSLK